MKKCCTNKPQKNHHVLRRAIEGPILAHDDFLLISCHKKTQGKILSGLSMSWHLPSMQYRLEINIIAAHLLRKCQNPFHSIETFQPDKFFTFVHLMNFFISKIPDATLKI